MLSKTFVVLLVVFLTIQIEYVKSSNQRKNYHHKLEVKTPKKALKVILDESGAPNALNMLVLDSFAKNIGLKVDYLISNTSLSVVFENKTNLDAFQDHLSLRYRENINAFSDIPFLRYDQYLMSNDYYLTHIIYTFIQEAVTFWSVLSMRMH